MPTEKEYDCQRCGTTIDHAEDHTKIIRRDYHGETEPSTVEYLCGECLDHYVSNFLGNAG